VIRQPFGELEVGQVAVSNGRTMTESDVVNFCMLTGNWLELHSNVEHAKGSLYGQRLVQGSLVFSIVNAMIPFDSSILAAFYGCDKLRFLRPTFIGDTLWAKNRDHSPEGSRRKARGCHPQAGIAEPEGRDKPAL